MLLKKLASLCAYSHLVKVLVVLVKGGDLSQQAVTGRMIALLGLFCPLFWFALFTGAERSELLFHAAHSSIVFLLGMSILILSTRSKN
ncbi:hypothetical protein [Vibrio sp. WXL103]|uniref:hypothetical protein n=1 Tax=Vibrio sp. WXL103 TaxID=3450710 RepID=UPI003EC87A92